MILENLKFLVESILPIKWLFTATKHAYPRTYLIEFQELNLVRPGSYTSFGLQPIA